MYTTFILSTTFLKKYLDDIICAVPFDRCNDILNIFNSYNPSIRFTIETETDQSVPFLDTLVVRDSNTLVLDWYKKATSSGRCINYLSYHHIKMKINFILEFKRRIKSICHASFYQKNLTIFKDILIDNSYPIPLINKLLFNSTDFIPEKIPNQVQDNNIPFRTLSFVQNITFKLTKLFHDKAKIAPKIHYH